MTKGTTIEPVEPVEQVTWGIIRYACGSGRSPDEDAAAFDGWYTARADALAVAEDWKRRFPQWIVGLVMSNLIWFGEGDYSGAEWPLTWREAKMLRAEPPVQ